MPNALNSYRALEIFIKLVFLGRRGLTTRSHCIYLRDGSGLGALINAWFTPDVTRVLVLPVINLRFFIIDVLALSVIEIGPTSLER